MVGEYSNSVRADSKSEEMRSRTALLSGLHAIDSIDDYMSVCRKWRKLDRVSHAEDRKELRFVLLSGSTTDFMELPLRVELDALGFRAEIHRPEFNTHINALLDPDSSSARFRPDLVGIFLDPFDIADWPHEGASETEAEALAEGFVGQWLDLCQTFHSVTGAEFILGNLRLPLWSPNGHLGRRLPWDHANYVRRINRLLAKNAHNFIHILDVEMLSSLYGARNWFDPRFWFHAKQPVSLDCIIPLVRDTAAIAAAIYGRATKCIVLDLDNTIWGGVVGDDGIEGLRLGPGTAEGEAFHAFQRHLLALKHRGILLAVCSKNEEETARAPFKHHEGMVLAADDIVSFRANWNPKPDNIRSIAEELNIGLDSIVFVDDNPAERELVRQTIPEVRVLELGDDPSQYPMLLSRSGWLETVSITAEDRQKSDQYLANRARANAQNSVVDYESYLVSLNQSAEIRSFEPADMDRIAQLINKTNQFNLTTQRMTRGEVETLASRKDAITASMRLTDKFGDNGLISVAAGLIKENVLTIDIWLMSCRVFKRGAEFALANHLMSVAALKGVTEVVGIYKPTKKNGLVADFYGELGFVKAGTDEQGNVTWRLHLAKYRPIQVKIDVTESLS